MKFYTDISEYYDYIFPYNSQKLTFIQKNIKSILSENIFLDIGCATGDLGIKLSEQKTKVFSFDYNEKMVATVKQKNQSDLLQVRQGDMLEIDTDYQSDFFDVVLCFGNTIVHLNDIDEIKLVLEKIYTVLKPSGTFLLQILNYENILKNNIEELPTIENDKIRFVRKYDFIEDNNKIEFKTELLIKSTNQIIENSIFLCPIIKKDLEKILYDVGFVNIKYFGNFAGKELLDDSLPLIISAEKT